MLGAQKKLLRPYRGMSPKKATSALRTAMTNPTITVVTYGMFPMRPKRYHIPT